MRTIAKKLFYSTLSSPLFTSENTLVTLFRRILYLFLLNKLGKVSAKHLHGFLWRCNFSVRGNGNTIIVGNRTLLFRCKLEVKGNNTTLDIGDDCIFGEVTWGLRDDGSVIKIGDRTQGSSDSFCSMEGGVVEVGEDSLFSYNVEVRNTDSHSIIDQDGNRTNPAENVCIGKHVWIAQDSLILKGSHIPDNSIIGAKSLVNKKFSEDGCIIAGAPAKVLKSGYNWSKQRL